jgi:glycosyltransferase involved in cell wall biosynthesis
MSNLRGSERWLLDVCTLLPDHSITPSIINFDCDRTIKVDAMESVRRRRIVKHLLGSTPLFELAHVRLLPIPRRLFSGSSIGNQVERNLDFVPLSKRFLDMLRMSDEVYFVQCQPRPIHLLFVLAAATIAGRKPVVAGVHVAPELTPFHIVLLKLFALMGVLRAFHTINYERAIELERRIGCPAKFIPNGLLFDRFSPWLEDKLDQQRFSILYVGGMTRNKGADLLPEIHSALMRQGIPFDMIICTSGGPLERNLRDWSKKMDNVRFKGFVAHDDLLPTYSKASVLVAPSRQEEFGLAVIESQASGTPVVATSRGGLRQIVVEGRTGFLVSECEPEAIARKLKEVYDIWCNDRSHFVQICKNAVQNVRESYQWSQIIDVLVGFLRRFS